MFAVAWRLMMAPWQRRVSCAPSAVTLPISLRRGSEPPGSSASGTASCDPTQPVQTSRLQRAGHHPGRLPERQLEQGLDGRTELDRRIKEARKATRAAIIRRAPGHVLVQPYQLRSTPAQRRWASSWCGGGWVIACSCPPSNRMVHVVNPQRPKLCDNVRQQAMLPPNALVTLRKEHSANSTTPKPVRF